MKINLTIRLYIHFDKHYYLKPIAINNTLELKEIGVKERSYSKSRLYIINSNEEVQDKDYYMNIDDWVYEKQQMIMKYCQKIKKLYNINVNPDEIQYTTQFCYNIYSEE